MRRDFLPVLVRDRNVVLVEDDVVVSAVILRVPFGCFVDCRFTSRKSRNGRAFLIVVRNIPTKRRVSGCLIVKWVPPATLIQIADATDA